jgi:hypothetical protein
MAKQNRKNLERVGVLAFLLVLTASSASALLPGENPGQRLRRRRAAVRTTMVSQMDVFGQNYASTDWSAVTSELVAHPEGAGNAAVMSIPISLGNVYLNRFEIGHAKSDLERAIQMFERVTTNRGLWGKRAGSGSVVSYLDVSLSRLDGECDIGGFESRIAALWDAAMVITAEEAGDVPPSVRTQSPQPMAGGDDAAQASLYAAAANFLTDDPRSGSWEDRARELASRFPGSLCQSPETVLAFSNGALAYRLLGRSAPGEFDSVLHGVTLTSPTCPKLRLDFQSTGPVVVVTPGDSLDRAEADSRIFAYRLSLFLVLFPPGSQCSTDIDDLDPSVDFYR